MDKRVLIFFPHKLKQRHGGPYSMLFHLKEGLRSLQHEVHFLSDLVSFDEGKEEIQTKPSFIKQAARSIIPKSWLDRRGVTKWLKQIEETDLAPLAAIDFTKYDILHFHETIDIWRYKRLLANFKGKILLTSHSPKPYHLELVEDVFRSDKKKIGNRLYSRLEEIDQFAYEQADSLLFPCEEATESYIELWPYFSQMIKRKKVGYVTTGVITSEAKFAHDAIRQKAGIPLDAFVITFVGRKIPVKGYDLLLEAAKSILPAFPAIYFVLVGRKDAQQHFQHERFIDTGWTDDPFSYVNAADLHVVPNRQTNFDLNVLEVLSLGKPLLLSNTGGNKFFQQFVADGIYFHEPNLEDFVKQLLYCYEQHQNLASAGQKNEAIYLANFKAERFANDQVEFYQSI